MTEEFFEEDDCDCGDCNCAEIEISSSEEVEVTEFGMTEDEIDEWINELTKLKEEKSSVELFIDENNVLKLNYEEYDEEDEGDED